LLQKKLEKINAESVGFTSVLEAVEYIRENPDILLLVDYKLDDLLALDLINDLKNINIDVPFIVMTGHGDQQLAVDMMKLGAYDYIVKEARFYNKVQVVVSKAIKYYETKLNLRISQEKYKTIFENIQDIYIEMNMDGDIIEISPSVEKILFYKRDNLINKNISEFFAKQPEVEKLLSSTKNEIHISDYEISITNNKGENIYCSINSRLEQYKDGSKKIIGTIRDITIRKGLERQILNKVIETEEEERKRIAEDLHDGLGPLLASIKLYVNMLVSAEDDKERKENLVKYTNELIDEAVSNTRSISNNLTPNVLNDFGLIKALESFCRIIDNTEEICINFKSNFNERLHETLEVIIYRIILELIHNTLKHAKATNIILSVTQKDSILNISYYDDGIGFNYEKISKRKTGYGIKNIINRANSINADLSFNNVKPKGYQVNMKMNLSNYII